MVAAAEKLNDPANGIYGFTGRGLRNANMTLWTNFFLNYGGEFLDAKGNILTDGPEAIEATKMYQRLLTKSGASGRRRLQLDGIDGLADARPRRDVDRRRRLGAADRGSQRLARGRQDRLHAGARRTQGPVFRRLMATASASPRPAPRRKPPTSIASGRCRRPWARGCCRAAAACRSATRSSTTRRCARASRRQEWLDSVIASAKISKLGLPVIVPVAEFRDLVGAARHRDAVGRGSRDRAEKGARAVPPDPGAQRKGVSDSSRAKHGGRRRSDAAAQRIAAGGGRRPIGRSSLPALIVVLAVIIFPWAYTIWMSLHEWKVGSPPTFVGLANYIRLPSDTRFVESIGHTLVYTALSVVLPLMFGTLRGGGVSQQISDARLPARPVHPADDGNAGRDRAGVDHDVPPATRHPQLSAVAGRHAAAAVGVSPRNRDPLAGAGRDLAMDAAGDADRARRPRRDPDRAL